MVIQHGGQENTHVVSQFEATDLGTPFKVFLHNSVKVETDAKGSIKKYTIPDLEGLLRVVAMSRLLHPRKLTGGDIRFLRKAAGLRQKDLAHKIDLRAETLSRVEADEQAISPQSEKLLRVYVLKTVMKLHAAEPGRVKANLEKALDDLFDGLTPIAAHAVDDVLELHFHRGRCPHCDGSGDNDTECEPVSDWESGVLAYAA